MRCPRKLRAKEHLQRGGRDTPHVRRNHNFRKKTIILFFIFFFWLCIASRLSGALLHLPLIFFSQRHSQLANSFAMLRLNANYPFFPKTPHRVCNRKLGNYYDSSSIFKHGGVGDDGNKMKKEQMFLSVSVKAMKEEGNGSGSMSFSGQSWDPSSEIQVPSDQRPARNISTFVFFFFSSNSINRENLLL